MTSTHHAEGAIPESIFEELNAISMDEGSSVNNDMKNVEGDPPKKKRGRPKGSTKKKKGAEATLDPEEKKFRTQLITNIIRLIPSDQEDKPTYSDLTRLSTEDLEYLHVRYQALEKERLTSSSGKRDVSDLVAGIILILSAAEKWTYVCPGMERNKSQALLWNWFTIGNCCHPYSLVESVQKDEPLMDNLTEVCREYEEELRKLLKPQYLLFCGFYIHARQVSIANENSAEKEVEAMNDYESEKST